MGTLFEGDKIEPLKLIKGKHNVLKTMKDTLLPRIRETRKKNYTYSFKIQSLIRSKSETVGSNDYYPSLHRMPKSKKSTTGKRKKA